MKTMTKERKRNDRSVGKYPIQRCRPAITLFGAVIVARPNATVFYLATSIFLHTMASRGWLQGKTVRKGGALASTSNTRSSTPQGVQSTSTTIFGGGVKDPSGRTSEFFVSGSHVSLFRILIPRSQSMDDQCPVCKSDRYLNPKLRLLVSSCYHKMYASC